MTVSDLLQGKPRDVITTTSETSVEEAMGVLIRNKISCLPVVASDKQLIGIISDKDIFRCVFEKPEDFRSHTVANLMSTNLIVGVPNDSVGYVAGLMTENRIRHIPIVNADKLVGLISVGDIVKTQMEGIKVENRYLRQYIDGGYPG